MRIVRVPGRCVLLALLVVSAAPTAAAAADRAGRAARYVPDELVVRFKPGVSGAERADARRDRGATVERALAVPRTQLLDLEGEASVREATAAFGRDPRVEFAEPNYVFRAQSNDPFFGDLWGLENLGGSGGVVDADIDAPEAWAAEQPAGAVRVAVVDQGVALDHPDLAGRLVAGHDYVDDDAVPAELAVEPGPVAHGTHVAGTIAAVRDNAIGVAGVTDQVEIMPMRVLDWTGNGANADVADAFADAAAAGAKVVNASLGGPSQSNAIQSAISGAPNTLFVVAAGNDNANNDSAATPQYPCNSTLANVLCVAASDRADARASFSNWGATSVDIAAPGVNVKSTYADFALLSQQLFDSGALPAGWTADPPWTLSAGAASQGAFGLGAARGQGNADSSVTTVPLDLAGRSGCQLLFDLNMDVAGSDEFRVEARVDGGSWTPVFSRTTDTPFYMTTGTDIPGGGAVELRFRYIQQGGGNGSGVTVDFVEAYCTTATYGALSGTSMATPLVAGAAALVLAQNPGFTPAQVKGRLLSTGDVSACWTGLTVSGKRLNLARALGVDVGPGPTATACGSGGAASSEPPPEPPPSQPAPSPSPAPAPPTGSDASQPPSGDGSTAPAPDQPATDRAAPGVTLALARVQRLARIRHRGLRTSVRCSERCTVSVRLYARTASGRAVLVGRSARRTAAGDERLTAVIRLSRRGRAFLRRGPRRRILTLSLSASDDAGNETKLRRRVSLRR